MEPFIKVMKALSDPNRVRMVKLLEVGELCACEIQELLGLAQSTISRHMKTLVEAGLVHARKEGVWLIYRLTVDQHVYSAGMIGLLADWLNDDPDLRRMRDRLPHVDRRTLCATRPDRLC